jgi:hypothetical protein
VSTILVWTVAVAALPQESMAVQVRVMFLVVPQPGEVVVAKSGVKVPSHLSLALTVTAGGSVHSRVSSLGRFSRTGAKVSWTLIV